MRKLLLALSFLAAVLAAGGSTALINKPKLLYAVVSGKEPQFDNKEHWEITTSLRLRMSGMGKRFPLFILSCYINTGETDTKIHEQRIEFIHPDGQRVITHSTDELEFVTIQGKFESFQRAYVSALIMVPAMDANNRENFGVYTIKIYLDGDLVKKYPYPIQAR